MGFFDFLTGSKKQTGTTKVIQDLPEELKPFVSQIMEDAKAFYEEQKEKGYQPYEGKTVADFDPDELAAFEKLKGSIGVQDPYIEEFEGALGDYGGSLDEFRKSIEGIKTDMTAEGLKEYMSPYQQAVVDVQKRKAQEDFAQRIMPEFEKQAIQAGGMSGLGSRAGVQAALLGTGQAQTLADIQAKGSQKAYEDAVRQFQYSQEAARQKAGDILGAEEARLGTAGEKSKLGLQKFNVALAEAGLLSDIGQQKRQRAQTLLDEAYAREMEKREFIPSQLAQYSGFIYGSPYTTALSKSTTTPRPSTGSQLLSAGLSGLQLYGMGGGAAFGGPGFSMKNVGRYAFGGINPYTKASAATGGKVGGLTALPVVRKRFGGDMTLAMAEDEAAAGEPNPYLNMMQQQKANQVNQYGLQSFIETAKAQQQAIKNAQEIRKKALEDQKAALQRRAISKTIGAMQESILANEGLITGVAKGLQTAGEERAKADIAISQKEESMEESKISDISKQMESKLAVIKARTALAKALREGKIDAKEMSEILKNLQGSADAGEYNALADLGKQYPEIKSITDALISSRSTRPERMASIGPRGTPKETVTRIRNP